MISGLLLSTVSVIFYFDVLFWQILFLFGVLIVLSLASTIANRVWTSWHVDKDWYLAYQGMHTTSCNISQHLAASRNISQQLTTSLTKVTPSSSCWYQVKCYTCLYHVYTSNSYHTISKLGDFFYCGSDLTSLICIPVN